jgi:hypothetical protein
MVKWKMKKNNDTSEAVNHRQYNGQMKNDCLWFTASGVSLFFFSFHLTIALSVIYSFWCIIVLFQFSFDHWIVCDLQLLMYQCSFSSNAMVKWQMKKNTYTSKAVDHRQCNGQMKNEKEQWYIRSCKSQTMQWVLFQFSFDHCIVCDLQLLMYHCSFSVFIWSLNYLWFTASDVSHSYIRSCKSQKIQWSNEKWKRTLIHQKL